MLRSGIEIPRVSFSTITFTNITAGSFFIGFDLDNSGKLSKIDNLGNITVIETGPNSRGVTIDSEFISGSQQTINIGELLDIPLNFEYNLFTFNLDGTAIIDGDLNIIE